MTSFKLLGAALIVAAMRCSRRPHSQAISEPGAYAFYHPNADARNAGAPTARDRDGAIACARAAMSPMRWREQPQSRAPRVPRQAH